MNTNISKAISFLFLFAFFNSVFSADFDTSVGDYNLYEGNSEGDLSSQNYVYFRNNELHVSTNDGRTFRQVGSGPFAGDGRYKLSGVERVGGGQWHIYSGECNVSGWVRETEVQGTNAEASVSTNSSGFIQLYRQAPLPDGAVSGIVFPGTFEEYCMPVISIESTDLPENVSVRLSNQLGHTYLWVDTSRFIFPDGAEFVEATVTLSGYNGYNAYEDGVDQDGYKKTKIIPSTGTLTIKITKALLKVSVKTTPDGATARPGGIATVNVASSLGGVSNLQIGDTGSIPINGPNDTVFMEAIVDGTVFVFDSWNCDRWTSKVNPETAVFQDITGNSAVNSATLSAMIKIANLLSFTGQKDGKGYVSPTSATVEENQTVTFKATATGSILKKIVYTIGGGDAVTWTPPKATTTNYYASYSLPIKVTDNTVATAYFVDRPRITNTEEEKAKSNISGGGGDPSSLPLPSLLGDDQLAGLTKLLQQQSQLEPGTWDYAVKLYEDEIGNRIAEIDSAINDPETADDLKDDLENYKSTFPTIGTAPTKTTTTSTSTTTPSTGTTTDTITLSEEQNTGETKSSDPALGAVGAGALLLFNLDKKLYKPYWTIERPETPLDKVIKGEKK